MSDVIPAAELLSSGPADGDWSEVLRRASRGRRRRLGSVMFVLVGAVALVIASAYAFGHPIIDFGSAPKGPPKVVNDFGSLEVGAPAGMAPGVLPHEARRITAVSIDGKEHILWVAPTKQGGFCESWSQFVGGCRADRHDAFAKHIDVGGTQDVIAGSFFQESGSKLELEYADGATGDVPFVWVTAPIDAGFYLFRVPDAHRLEGHRPTSIRLLDDDGKVVAEDPIAQAAPPALATHDLPGYPRLSVPVEALWDQREQLFDLRADDKARLGLWVAPERGGGTCFWFNQGMGCTHGNPRAIPRPHALDLGFSGAATHVTLCCDVGRDVAKVEVRFEDGDRTELTPKRGYLLWPIPARHYPVGTRLLELLGFDDQGHKIASRRMSTNQRGLYPCTKPKDYGYGVSMCP